jgi:hypothetical protein
MSLFLPARGSEFYIYANCEISYELMRKSGEEPATTYAFKGTKVHRVLAASGSIGDLEADESKTFEELWNKFRDTVRTWRNGEQIDEVWNEQEFVYRLEGGQLLFTGHPDKVLKSGSRLFIPDFKSGWHPLDAISATNLQLRTYVALSDQNIPGITEATVWIDKPGYTSPPAVYDRKAIDAAKEWAVDVALRVTGPGEKKPLRGPWCQYCSGKVICPLWRDEIQGLAAASQVAIEDMPDHQLALIGPKLGIARKVIERLEARLAARVRENPEFFADWHFERGRLLPEILSVAQAWQTLQEDLDNDADAFLGATELTIGKLVELYREKKKTTWKGAREQVDKKLGDNLKYARAKPSLVYDPQARAINTVEHGS